MRRHLSCVLLLLSTSAPVWAQGAAPKVAPLPPLPPKDAKPFMDKFDFTFDTKLDTKLDLKLDSEFAFALKDGAWKLTEQALSPEMRADIERAVADAKEQARFATEDARMEIERAFEEARLQFQNVPNVAGVPQPGGGPQMVIRQSSAGDAYNRGQSALGQRQYDRAIASFDQVIAAKSPRADAALYWKAFAQFKQAKTTEALASIAQLRKDYGQSPYLNDARVLEADARRLAGQPVDPATLQDGEIKLLALQRLQNEKVPNVIPLLEGLINATNELEVKKRAIFVLALNEDPQAHQVLLRYAKGGGNPDLQVEAIRRLGSRNDQQKSGNELLDIYNSTSDINVKLAVVDALRSSLSKAALLNIASGSNASADVRGRAISSLNGVATPDDVVALYQKETDRNLKMQLLNTLGSMRAADQLAQIIRTEKDPALRQRAIRSLGNTRVESTRQALVDLYGAEQDRPTKQVIIDTMAGQNNGAGLVALARKETSIDMKREIVRRLSEMRNSKEATDYMLEVLK